MSTRQLMGWVLLAIPVIFVLASLFITLGWHTIPVLAISGLLTACIVYGLKWIMEV